MPPLAAAVCGAMLPRPMKGEIGNHIVRVYMDNDPRTLHIAADIMQSCTLMRSFRSL